MMHIPSPSPPPPTQRSTLSHRCAIRTGERGRAVESSRSSLAMPHGKPVGIRVQPASETHSTVAERMPSRRICRQLLSRHPCEQCAQRTVMSMWSMSMTCMAAWLGGRGLAYGGGRTHPTQRERHRARPPTLCRAAASKRQRCRHGGRAGSATRYLLSMAIETRKRACRAVFRVCEAAHHPLDAEARRGGRRRSSAVHERVQRRGRARELRAHARHRLARSVWPRRPRRRARGARLTTVTAVSCCGRVTVCLITEGNVAG